MPGFPGSRRHLRLLFFVGLLLVAWLVREVRFGGSAAGGEAVIEEAFRDGRSGVAVEAEGRVERILADDLEGSRHQRFILRLEGGRTLLVSHNIDLAPRVPLSVGDRVGFRGRYEWNERGGVVHWTHHDPDGRDPGGWLRHRGETYR